MNKANDYEVQEDYVIMYTSKGEMFLIDLEDFEKVRKYCWHFNKQGYVRAKDKNGHRTNKHILLHRFVMGFPKGMLIDHIHGKKSRYDNRKSNLRIATPQQNQQNRGMRTDNSSGVIGVCWASKAQAWMAYIHVDKKRKHLGCYESFDEAVKVRKEAEEKYFGEWAYAAHNNYKENDL